MKKIDSGHYTHLGYDVYYASHPKLSGAYEIYNGEMFICRAYDLTDAKIKIQNDIRESKKS